MKYLDEYRDTAIAKKLVDQICNRVTRPWVLMDVCGGQTHSLVRNGIEQELSGIVELIHGPGCPVCVTPINMIDFAINLSLQDDTIVVSFGDMMRVPGSVCSLLEARSKGGQVRIVYSPLDALRIAVENPSQSVVFLGVGFETTAPATALAVLQAANQGIENFSVITAHVRVQPAMEAIIQSPDNRVDGFLAAGHVCAITGFATYACFVQHHQVPVVVTGFEPIDLLKGILECVTQLESGQKQVVNRYGRNVSRKGNQSAIQLIDKVYEIADRPWRGFGVIPSGGLALREQWKDFDASRRFKHLSCDSASGNQICRASDVMSGKIKPKQCPAFGTACTPESPLGAPMVSSEGACAAYFRFDPIQITTRVESK